MELALPSLGLLPSGLCPYRGNSGCFLRTIDSPAKGAFRPLAPKTDARFRSEIHFFPDSSHWGHSRFKDCWVKLYSEFKLKVLSVPCLPHSLRQERFANCSAQELSLCWHGSFISFLFFFLSRTYDTFSPGGLTCLHTIKGISTCLMPFLGWINPLFFFPRVPNTHFKQQQQQNSKNCSKLNNS